MVISCLIIKTSIRQDGGVKAMSAWGSRKAFLASIRQDGGVEPRAHRGADRPSWPPSDRMEE